MSHTCTCACPCVHTCVHVLITSGQRPTRVFFFFFSSPSGNMWALLTLSVSYLIIGVEDWGLSPHGVLCNNFRGHVLSLESGSSNTYLHTRFPGSPAPKKPVRHISQPQVALYESSWRLYHKKLVPVSRNCSLFQGVGRRLLVPHNTTD